MPPRAPTTDRPFSLQFAPNSKANPAPAGCGSEARRFLEAAAGAMADTAKYNRSNPAVKRILQEVKEMQSNPSPDFMALPLEVPHLSPIRYYFREITPI
jgi:hypothetical protein